MVDRSHERANEESRAEVAALVVRLTRPQLRADLGEGLLHRPRHRREHLGWIRRDLEGHRS